MFVFSDIFSEIVALLLLAAVAGAVATRLRQPLIVAFIAVGILVGPSGLNLLTRADQLHVLAEMGLAVLLFVVGLRLDLHLIRTLGPVALATGLGQVAFTTVGGFFIAYALGMSAQTALWVAVALTFSSTIIIVKLLSDKREVDSLHGRIALGFLIVQDIVVVIAMVLLSASAGPDVGHPALHLLALAAKGAAVVAGAWLMGFVIFPRLLHGIARSPELLVLVGVAWAVALANLTEVIGFSKEVGAFFAGVALASTPYREILGSKLVSLRDFLLLFFFVDLGAQLDLRALGPQVYAAAPLSAFVLVGNPLIVMMIMGFLGYRKRTGFLAGLTVAQISEFSLILMAMGARLGHVGPEAVGVVTLVGVVTIGLSTYLITYSHHLYEWLSPYLGVFERRTPYREDATRALEAGLGAVDVVVFGLGRYGSHIAGELCGRGRRVLGVDFDPQAVRRWRERGGLALFGDAEDVEFAATLPLGAVRWVVCAIREVPVRNALLRALQHVGYRGHLAVAVDEPAEAERVAAKGAHLTLVPFRDAADEAVHMMVATEERLARKAMDEQIERISDHYIVCGFGRMGQQIVKDLTRGGVPVVVVESNAEHWPALREQGIPHVEGSASDDEVLVKAGIRRAKGLIAVTSTDEENVFIVLTARVLNPQLYIVARSILEENEQKLLRAGADRAMSPYILGGRRMALAVLKPQVVDFLDLLLHSDEPDTEIRSIGLPAGSRCVGKSLSELEARQRCGVTVLAVRREGEELHTNPDPDFVLREGDELIILGSPARIEQAQGELVG